MKKLIATFALSLVTTLGFGQKFQPMEPNMFTYVHAGGGNPYISGKIGYEFRPSYFVELQGFTDGGGIWNNSTYNDWRTLSLLKAVRISKIKTEIRAGAGIVQSSEQLLKQRFDSFGFAPQVSAMVLLHPNVGMGVSYTHPISSITNLSPALTVGIEYRIGRYEPNDGLY